VYDIDIQSNVDLDKLGRIEVFARHRDEDAKGESDNVVSRVPTMAHDLARVPHPERLLFNKWPSTQEPTPPIQSSR